MNKSLFNLIFVTSFLIPSVFYSKTKFCDITVSSGDNIASIEDVKVQKEDSEKVIPLIKKYSPIIYLHSNEPNLPIRVDEFFTGSKTALINKTNGKVIAPKGSITMNKIYDLYKTSQGKLDYYFDIEPCLKLGSDPQKNKDATGNLNTPIYVITFNKNGKLYIQYLFFYAFNAPYSIAGLFSLFSKYLTDFRGAHFADLEHVTFEFDEKTKKPLRIYFGSHGRYEGMWLDWDNKDLQKEGDHPIIFVARGSHGMYPKEGTYVRVFGMLNDITNKGIRWIPKIVRIYKDSDKRFNPTTMGWLYHAGTYGKGGVDAACSQSWFCNVEEDIGRPYEKVPFCQPGSSKICLIKAALGASLPK